MTQRTRIDIGVLVAYALGVASRCHARSATSTRVIADQCAIARLA